MGGEKEGARSEAGHVGFFHLFDWTSKSRKILFETKSDLPESLKQRRKIDCNLAIMQHYMVEEDEIGVGTSTRESNDHSYASSVIDDEVCGTKAPGVVARLMGLDSMPSSSFPDPYSTPYYESQSLQDVQFWRTNQNHLHDHQILYCGKLIEKFEGSSRNFMEPKPQKIHRPIEKFQTEVMAPKSAKSVPATHHKLLSPIKSPAFVPKNNATYIMESTARIIEPCPHATKKANKTPLVASSTVSLRVRDLKQKVETSQKGPLIGSSSLTYKVRDLKEKREIPHRTSRLSEPSQRSSESNDAKYLKGQSLNKTRNGPVDTSIRYPTEAEEDSSLKNKGKSVSLAIQAKVNVQRREREGLSVSGGKNLVDQKEQCDIKTNQLLKANVQKSLHKKSSTLDASGVLRQNNLKQNCSIDKGKLPSKPLVSNLHSRKVLTGESSYGHHRSSSSKSIAKSKAGSKKSSMQVTDSEKEVLYTHTNNFPRKKRSTDRDWNDRVVDNLFNDKTQKPVQSKVSNESHSWTEEVKKKDMDVVSFTFTTPLVRSNYGFKASTDSTQAGLKTNGLLDQHIERVLHDTDTDTDSTSSPIGYNVIGGDALGFLLEQKLRELAYGVENSCDDSLKARSPSCNAPKDLVPTLNSVNLIRQQQQKKDHDVMLIEKLFSSRESDISFTCLPELSSKRRLGVDEMDKCNRNTTEAELFNSRQPSPMSVLDPSFSTESCESSFSTNAANAENQTRRRQILDLESANLGMNSSRKFDSACSASIGTMLKKHTSTFSQMKFGHSPSPWEFDYVNDILCHVELMYMDFALGRAREIVNPHLFNQLENRKGRFESDGGECRKRRKVLFDCVSECLDLRCRRYVGGGYKMWAKGVAMVRRNEWLAREVYKEISSWRDMDDSNVDELVDRDMRNQYGQWLDFEVDTFELGAKVEDQIFNSLVDDFVAEILQL